MGKEYFYGRTADEYDIEMNAGLGDPERPVIPPLATQRAERVMIWLCRLGLLIFILSLPWGLAGCASVPVMATVHTFSSPTGTGNFFDAPCTSETVLARVPQELRKHFKHAEGTYEGKPYELCWAYSLDGRRAVVVVWEDGGVGVIQREYLDVGKGTGT